MSTLSAETSLSKKTHTYTGEATTLYLYSANSGINIYGIKLIYPEDTTDIEAVSSDSKAYKIIREGRLLILRDNKTYNVLGFSL